MNQLIDQLGTNLIIWLNILLWVSLMAYIHYPQQHARPSRNKVPARYIYWPIGMLMAINLMASTIRVANQIR